MNRHSLVWGSVFLVLGVIFLLDAIGAIRVGGSIVWPVLLIAVGVAVLLGATADRAA